MRTISLSSERRSLAASWNDSGVLYHQNHRSLERPCTMNHSFRDNEPLSRVELNSAVFKIDNQPAFNNVKEFVVVIVLVPMIFTFNDAKAHY